MEKGGDPDTSLGKSDSRQTGPLFFKGGKHCLFQSSENLRVLVRTQPIKPHSPPEAFHGFGPTVGGQPVPSVGFPVEIQDTFDSSLG